MAIVIDLVRLQLLVAVLLSDSRFFALQFHLLVSLLFDHVVCPLIKAHTSLCFNFLFDEAAETLGLRTRNTRGCRADAAEGMVLLAIKLINFSVCAASTYGRCVGTIYGSLTVLTTVLFVSLVVRVYVFLLHA